ncbi:hypothetical protein [Parahaliea mediterranea]|uniref:hypothetical protein n=1 Tax=Parahaliea mediterranea TaxID=651086 RepID=UPI00130027E0|nr:hypothetical protein [Parahaliea mediterranea]
MKMSQDTPPVEQVNRCGGWSGRRVSKKAETGLRGGDCGEQGQWRFIPLLVAALQARHAPQGSRDEQEREE